MNSKIRSNIAWKKKSKGFTLIEMGAVLAVAGIALFLIIKLITAMNIRNTAKDINTSLVDAQIKVARLYPTSFAAVASCVPLITNNVFSAGTFRIDKTVPATPTVSYSNEPGSTLTCASDTITSAGDGIALGAPAMSDDLCAELVGRVNPLAWIIKIDGTTVKTKSGTLNTNTAGTLCTNTAATTDNHTVTFILGRTLPPQ